MLTRLRTIFRHPVYKLSLPFIVITLLGVVFESRPLIAFGFPVVLIAFVWQWWVIARGPRS